MLDTSPRLHPMAFKVRFYLALLSLLTSVTQAGIGSLLGLALLMASARTYIRLQNFRRIFLDDVFLFLAVACLLAGVGLLYSNIQFLYE